MSWFGIFRLALVQMALGAVVVLTTSKEDRDRLRAFGLSAAGYMVKPVDYPLFVDVMRTVRDYWMRSETPPL